MLKRTFLVLLFTLVSAVSVGSAQRVGRYEQLTVDGTARQIATATLDGMRACQAVLEQAEIRYRGDGVAPTTTVGTILSVGSSLDILNVVDGATLKLIRTGATSGILNIHCWQ